MVDPACYSLCSNYTLPLTLMAPITSRTTQVVEWSIQPTGASRHTSLKPGKTTKVTAAATRAGQRRHTATSAVPEQQCCAVPNGSRVAATAAAAATACSSSYRSSSSSSCRLQVENEILNLQAQAAQCDLIETSPPGHNFPRRRLCSH